MKSVRTIAALLAVLAAAAPAAGHDIPNDVTVHAFVKPDASPGSGEPRLRLLVRVPLRAMRDVEFPARQSGALDLARVDASLRHAAMLWIADGVELYENDRRLGAPRLIAARVSLPSDRSFGSYEDAVAHVTGPPLSDATEIPWDQSLLDVLFEYPIASERSRFSIRPAFGRLALRVVTVLRFLPPGGGVRAFEYAGDPGVVRLDPRWHQAAASFVKLGFLHILEGLDHLLFLVCLVIPLRRIKPLVLVVTAFTVAHSATLAAAAFGFAPGGLWFPPLIETLIAASIVYMALENIVSGAAGARRWMIAFGFGLVHGFGFSFALRETLQFAGSHLLTSLLSFNLGVELGQLLVLAVLVPAIQLAFRAVVAERMGTIILSALVAHTAWHWMTDRADRLRQFAWPALDAAAAASAMRWTMALLILGALWMLLRRFQRSGARGQGWLRSEGSDRQV
jgi:hypothetical protein